MFEPIYLTNTPLDDEGVCLAAAKASGFNVKFLREPMPYDGTFEDEFYNREALIGAYGCVVSFEPPDRSHSPFWRAWYAIKASAAAESRDAQTQSTPRDGSGENKAASER